MLRRILALCGIVAAASNFGAAQVVVHVDATQLEAPRALAEQTRSAAIRDYLESWQTLGEALANNRADLLDADFVGAARERLTKTIQDQAALGISTKYGEGSHQIQLLFYSPEGLSIELADTANYDLQVFDHGQLLTTRPERTRYIVVLTPSEVRWRVRIFQADPD
jgi:hypothetical protein